MRRLAGVTVMLAVFVGIGFGLGLARATGDPVIPYPNEAVDAALERLSEPSVPNSLPGDPTVAVGRYGHEGACDEVRAAYQAPDAPVPAGSSVTVDAVGNVQVDAPFGRAAIILADRTAGGCEYAVEATPTLVISGAGVRETASFTNVVCSTVLGLGIAGGDFDTDAGPFFLAAATGDSPGLWKVGIRGGHLVDGLKGQPTPGASTEQVVWDATVMATDGGYVFDGPGPQGPVHVELTCTPYKGST